MSQLASIKRVAQDHTKNDEDAGKLLWDILGALDWDIEGVGNAEDATVYLQMDRER